MNNELDSGPAVEQGEADSGFPAENTSKAGNQLPIKQVEATAADVYNSGEGSRKRPTGSRDPTMTTFHDGQLETAKQIVRRVPFFTHFCIHFVQSDSITSQTRTYFTQGLCDRLNKLNGYINLETRCVTLHTLPLGQVGWGPVGYRQADKSGALCIKSQPIMMWVIAEIICPTFRRRGQNLHKGGVLFKLLLESDSARASILMNKRCLPQKDMRSHFKGLLITDTDLVISDLMDEFWVMRWMGDAGLADEDVSDA